MIDLILRVPDEAGAVAALARLRGAEGWITASHHHALDVIGPMATAPAILDAEGQVVTPPVLDGAFHVNLLLDPDHPDAAAIQAAAAPCRIDPVNRRRVWA
jgi:hypothetical protein